MRQAYEACASERGTGSFARMKGIMERHVQAMRSHMFRNARRERPGSSFLLCCFMLVTAMQLSLQLCSHC